MKVILLGAGKLGKQLYKSFVNNQTIDLIQWYNRSETNLISPEGIALTNSLDAIEKADLYILAVSDDVISSISKKTTYRCFVDSYCWKCFHRRNKES